MARGPKPQHVVRLTAEEYVHLQHIARLRKAPHAQVVRAKILVLAYEHSAWDNGTIARKCGCEVSTVRKWRAASRAGPCMEEAPRSGGPRFFPSAQRAQITALACTLPVESGRPLSRWSSSELAREAVQRGIASDIAAATVRRWLREDRITPWQRHAWQQSTDPECLKKATVALNLYARADALARRGERVVCADEKTGMQARTATGGMDPAQPGKPVRHGARYVRKGVLHLFAGLLVHTGETMVRCFPRKRFMEFQDFLQMIFRGLWTKRIRVLHLILDNGSTHAPKQIRRWIRSLELPFTVRVHWLPVNASWLDQVEIVCSPLERKVLTPTHCTDVHDLENRVMHYFAERNLAPKPIQWSYTSTMLRRHFSSPLAQRPVLCAV